MLILASASPRRRELLHMLGIGDFKVIPSTSPEKNYEGKRPEDKVLLIALDKARGVASEASEEEIVIAADTMVFLDGKLLGKPETKQEAEEMLRLLSGKKHCVYTGVAVIGKGRTITGVQASDVYFRSLRDGEIRAYVETGEPMDKAGAYGIQGKGSMFVEKIDGDYFNIVGLPLCLLGKMLEEVDYHII